MLYSVTFSCTAWQFPAQGLIAVHGAEDKSKKKQKLKQNLLKPSCLAMEIQKFSDFQSRQSANDMQDNTSDLKRD